MSRENDACFAYFRRVLAHSSASSQLLPAAPARHDKRRNAPFTHHYRAEDDFLATRLMLGE